MLFDKNRFPKYLYIFILLTFYLFSSCENINFGGDIKANLDTQLLTKVSFYESIESDSPHTDET